MRLSPPAPARCKVASLHFGVTRCFFHRAQVLICGELQIETLLRLPEFLPCSFRGVFSLLKLHLCPGAELNLNQGIVPLHELAGRDQDMSDARFKRDRDRMRFARLRNNASVNDYFFGDRFSFHFCNLHFRDRTSGLLLFPDAESLRDPDEGSDKR